MLLYRCVRLCTSCSIESRKVDTKVKRSRKKLKNTLWIIYFVIISKRMKEIFVPHPTALSLCRWHFHWEMHEICGGNERHTLMFVELKISINCIINCKRRKRDSWPDCYPNEQCINIFHQHTNKKSDREGREDSLWGQIQFIIFSFMCMGRTVTHWRSGVLFSVVADIHSRRLHRPIEHVILSYVLCLCVRQRLDIPYASCLFLQWISFD